MPPPRRRCKGRTLAGKRCRAWPLKDSKFCLAHDEEARGKVGFGGPQLGSGRPAKPRAIDEMRRLVEDHARVILAPYFRTLGLELHDDGSVTECDGAVVVVKFEGEATASDIQDLGARIAAAERLLDRVCGKPKQEVEVAGSETPIRAEIVAVDDRERADAARDYLRRIAGD